MDNPNRWKQRFDNFTKAYYKLVMVAEHNDLRNDEIAKMALIQAFEFTFELAWKTLKDFMEEEGFELNSPKSVIRQAFQSRYITNGEVWMEALKKRNNTVHNYDSLIMDETVNFIVEEFYPVLRQWYSAFSERQKQ
jgi:nucleotidyltransferase substrate binding protein (TIGR01987 family)